MRNSVLQENSTVASSSASTSSPWVSSSLRSACGRTRTITARPHPPRRIPGRAAHHRWRRRSSVGGCRMFAHERWLIVWARRTKRRLWRVWTVMRSGQVEIPKRQKSRMKMTPCRWTWREASEVIWRSCFTCMSIVCCGDVANSDMPLFVSLNPKQWAGGHHRPLSHPHSRPPSRPSGCPDPHRLVPH